MDTQLVVTTPSPFQMLELEHFSLGPTGLIVKGEPTIDQWAGIGELIKTLERGVQWIAGDWLAFGEAVYGEMASQAMEGLAAETLRVYAWTASRVPKENRVGSLSFAHHQHVAALQPHEQSVWLQRAASGDVDTKTGECDPWSSNRLRQELRTIQEKGTTTYVLSIEFDQPSDRDIVAQEHERVGRACRRTEKHR